VQDDFSIFIKSEMSHPHRVRGSRASHDIERHFELPSDINIVTALRDIENSGSDIVCSLSRLYEIVSQFLASRQPGAAPSQFVHNTGIELQVMNLIDGAVQLTPLAMSNMIAS